MAPSEVFLQPMEKIAQTIKARREVLSITQAQLAEIAGVGLRNLKALESGKGNPKLQTILKLMDALGMSLEFVVKRSQIDA